MASIWEKAISILEGNLNSGRSYLITAVDRPKSNSLHTARLKSNDFEKQREGWKRHFKLEIAGHCEIYFLLQLGMGGL